MIKREIDSLSADFADFERVRVFTLLDKEFTIDAGKVTPTQKLKRKTIVEITTT